MYEELYRQCGCKFMYNSFFGEQGVDLVSKAVNKCIKDKTWCLNVRVL